MKPSMLLDALDLPASAMVEKRVPKTMLHEHGAPTAADKRQINEGIEQLVWVAALKPTTIGVAEYRDELREVLEIAVLQLTLRTAAKVGRLIELVHRAVPYPVLLIAEQGTNASLSLAHKRWSQAEAGATVLDADMVAAVAPTSSGQMTTAFLASLSLSSQPRADLFRLYQGWIDAVQALLAAQLTGRFSLPGSLEHAVARREALHEAARLEAQITRLRAAAAKERQVPRQVELNLALKRAEAARASALTRL
jgi:hypothetical protein